jgi:hypothetical protein
MRWRMDLSDGGQKEISGCASDTPKCGVDQDGLDWRSERENLGGWQRIDTILDKVGFFER